MDSLFEQIAMSALQDKARSPRGALLPQRVPPPPAGPPPGRAAVPPPPVGPPPPGWAPPSARGGADDGNGFATARESVSDAAPCGDADDADDGFVVFSTRLVRALAAQAVAAQAV